VSGEDHISSKEEAKREHKRAYAKAHYAANKEKYNPHRRIERERIEEKDRLRSMALTRPEVRVWRALARCTKYRWISPVDLFNLGVRLASCIPNVDPERTTRSSIGWRDCEDCSMVGMLRGLPPFKRGHPLFEEMVAATRKRFHPRSVPMELFILNLELKGMKNGCKPVNDVR